MRGKTDAFSDVLCATARNTWALQWVAERYRDRMNAVYPGSVRGLFGVHAAPHGTLDTARDLFVHGREPVTVEA